MKRSKITVLSGPDRKDSLAVAKAFASGKEHVSEVYATSFARFDDMAGLAKWNDCIIVDNCQTKEHLKILISWAILASESCSMIITCTFPITSSDLGVRALTYT